MRGRIYWPAEFVLRPNSWTFLGQKSEEFSFLLFTVTSTNGFYSPPPPPREKVVWNWFCNVNFVDINLKSENSQDYAQKPQQNCARSWIRLQYIIEDSRPRQKEFFEKCLAVLYMYPVCQRMCSIPPEVYRRCFIEVVSESYFINAGTLQWKPHLCIPFLGTASLNSNFHIHVFVSELQ
jgi:hypothetical protein